MKWPLGWSVIFSILLVSGCASLHYERTERGQLNGKVIVEWRKPDLFTFRPDSEQPLLFVRKSGEEIKPEAMFTDGGSIPRPFWVLKNYSPWGYGPAFIVHDWLFHMQNCKLPGYEKYSVEEAATIMSEVMKTMMESPGFDYGSKTTMYLMYEAVQSQPARDAWTNGRCVTPELRALAPAPDEVFVVEFPSKARNP
jgi:hypothetical protein